jgi:hypothetical protein
VKIGVNAVLPPATSTQPVGGVFQLSSPGWAAVGAGAAFTPVANGLIDNWSSRLQLVLKNVNTTVSPQVGYNDYVLNKTYGGSITVTGGSSSFSYAVSVSVSRLQVNRASTTRIYSLVPTRVKSIPKV